MRKFWKEPVKPAKTTKRDLEVGDLWGIFRPNKKFDLQRIKDNAKLLNHLGKYMLRHPTERFGQALRNVGLVRDFTDEQGVTQWTNEFNTEPAQMLKRVQYVAKAVKSRAKNKG